MRQGSWMFKGLIVSGLMLSLGLPAQAALIDRGGGFIYDDVLDITWTQNASLSGANTWDNQVTWADQLSILDTVRNVTWDDWRLASMSVAGGTMDTGTAASVVDCSSATEEACRDNELGYMFYHNLGGTFGDDLRGTQTTSNGVEIQSITSFYWSGTESAPNTGDAWHFTFWPGFQDANIKSNDNFAWAVRSGDVTAAPVPVPGTMLLMGSGLVGLLGWRHLQRG